MRAVEFPQANTILGASQPQYIPLPAHWDKTSPEQAMTSCFELTDEEVEEIVRTRRIWNTQLTFGRGYHPVRMSCSNPFEPQAPVVAESAEEKPLNEILPKELFTKIHEAIGHASMCWEKPEGAGIFDDTQAAEVASNLCREVAAYLKK